jgi:hypothetical protein
MPMFFVWCSNSNGRIPTFTHTSIELATKEAERLARLHPDTEFHVLTSVGFCMKQDVKWQRMPQTVTDMDLPF